MPIYAIKSPEFLSQLDEELFFIGLRLVPEVRKYRGVNVDLHVELSDAPSNELLGLLKRYETRLRKPRSVRRVRAILKKGLTTHDAE